MTARTPESLTRLERAWCKRQSCAWCDAPVHANVCYAMHGDCAPDPAAKKCTDVFLNERRGLWLSEHYKPRDTDGNPKGADAKLAAGESLTAGAEGIAQDAPQSPQGNHYYGQ